MDRETRDALIARYEDGYQEVADALAEISERELDTRAAPGEWSPREIVHHLADSEMTSALRLRCLLAEDAPAIVGYDEAEYAHRLYYDRPIAASLAAFQAARDSTAQIVRRLGDEEWGRTGTHSESGPYGVEDWLRIYAAHAHDHAEQIRRARAAAAC